MAGAGGARRIIGSAAFSASIRTMDRLIEAIEDSRYPASWDSAPPKRCQQVVASFAEEIAERVEDRDGSAGSLVIRRLLRVQPAIISTQ